MQVSLGEITQLPVNPVIWEEGFQQDKEEEKDEQSQEAQIEKREEKSRVKLWWAAKILWKKCHWQQQQGQQCVQDNDCAASVDMKDMALMAGLYIM
ncbi:RING finger protein 227 isoform X2 [Protopterus annectens]|uniref:RING finger protein 227 isoform X2 n=1 Tax=Protopterus annectens TaxID=7888 RepID=UPI001CFB9B06|nr:RING finger protein 227 isoform X2 [Protopterus annectens]